MNTETTAPTEQQSAAPSARPEDRITIRVQAGFMVDPPLWSTRPSAKNWAAVVSLHGQRPGGLERRWLKTGRGALRYSIYTLRVGDIIEFAADSATQQERQLVVLEGIAEGHLLLRRFAEILPAADYQQAVLQREAQRREALWKRQEEERARVEAERQKVREAAKAARQAMAAQAPGAAPMLRRKATLVGRIEKLERELNAARQELAGVEENLTARREAQARDVAAKIGLTPERG